MVATPRDESEVYETLRHFGAPLANRQPVGGHALEPALVRALSLAHADATLLRVLPLVVSKNAAGLDFDRLRALAQAENVEAELGLVVEVALVSRDEPALRGLQRQLRPPEGRPPKPFFPVHGRVECQWVEREGLPLARRWGFLLNMGQDSFDGLFAKHSG